MRIAQGIVLCLGFWLCIGCAPAPINDSLSSAPPTTPFALRAGSIGQTFVARHAGLQHIAVYFVKLDNGTAGQLLLHLRDSAVAGANDLRAVVAIVPALPAPQWVSFDFAPLSQSRNQSYYFF